MLTQPPDHRPLLIGGGWIAYGVSDGGTAFLIAMIIISVVGSVGTTALFRSGKSTTSGDI